jgi:hypothetical protein
MGGFHQNRWDTARLASPMPERKTGNHFGHEHFALLNSTPFLQSVAEPSPSKRLPAQEGRGVGGEI